MLNNDVLLSIRYILNANDQKISEILNLAGQQLPAFEIGHFFKADTHADYKICDDNTMAHFLDGLIYYKRGKDESRPPLPLELPISNNLVLKKLRVAFQLKEPDMHEVLEMGNYPIGRAEMSALLRKRDHINYRECGDQVLRYFLKGLALKFRGKEQV